MLLKIGRRPDHGFDEPLGLLSDCHRRIEHFLSVLRGTTMRAGGAPLDASQRIQLEAAREYFATAAPRHTADEEGSLFPRLQASQDPAAVDALEIVDRLEREHAEADRHHATVDRLVSQWLGNDALSTDDVRTLNETLARLDALYTKHIAIEEQQLFPAAVRILSAADLQQIGREMVARRSGRPG
jgi:hemerythrin-like domain-containing protein